MNPHFVLAVSTAAMMVLAGHVGASIPLNIINPSFEDAVSSGDGLGGTFGWTHTPAPGPNGLGAVTTTTPDPTLTPPGGAHDGTFFIWGRGDSGASGAVSPSMLFQRLDVTPYASQIDAGLVTADFIAYGLGDDVNNDQVGDFARMRLRFFDNVAGGSILETPLTSNVGVAPTWTAMTLDSVRVPVGTRSFEIALSVNRPLGSFNDAGFDDVASRISVVPEPSTLGIWLALVGIGTIVRRHRPRGR